MKEVILYMKLTYLLQVLYLYLYVLYLCVHAPYCYCSRNNISIDISEDEKLKIYSFLNALRVDIH